LPTDIDREDVRTMLVSGAQIIETLPSKQYEDEHLPGAINILLKNLDGQTAAALDPNKPVIVYCHDHQCDLSARAAWRLETLGFTRVFRYSAGKADWLANGLPIEGKQAGIPRAGALARTDVPICHLNDRAGDVFDRMKISNRVPTPAPGWDMCVVINGRRVTLGVLSGEAMISYPNAAAEQLMEPGPTTIRPNWSFEDTSEYLKSRNLDRVLVTTSDGVLVGVYFQAYAAGQMDNFRMKRAAASSSGSGQKRAAG
jgi:rhodanese-related sulfurtransferase